jgi:hypothetical protein
VILLNGRASLHGASVAVQLPPGLSDANRLCPKPRALTFLGRPNHVYNFTAQSPSTSPLSSPTLHASVQHHQLGEDACPLTQAASLHAPQMALALLCRLLSLLYLRSVIVPGSSPCTIITNACPHTLTLKLLHSTRFMHCRWRWCCSAGCCFVT